MTIELLDFILLLLLLAFIGNGVRKGLIYSCSKLVSTVGGFIGARMLAGLLKKNIAAWFFFPWINKSMETSAASISQPIEQAVGELSAESTQLEQQFSDALHAAGIPRISLSNSLGQIIDSLTGTGHDILNASSQVISERLAFVLVFIISFCAIQLACAVLFHNMEGIARLPLLKTVNNLGGGALGFLLGISVLSLLLWLALTFFPALTLDNGLLTSESLQKSYLTRILYQLVAFLFP